MYKIYVDLRFGEHHGKGILLDFRRSVEAHFIDAFEQLRFPE